MSNRKALGIVAGLVLLVGVVVGFLPVSVGTAGEVSCGSAFYPSYASAGIRDIVEGGGWADDCRDAVSGRRLFAFPLAVAGAAVLLFLWLTASHTTRWDQPEGRPADESAA